MSIVQGIDNDNCISCVGVFRTGAKTAAGSPVSVGCMVRLECNPQSAKYRVTVRALHPDVGTSVKNVIRNQLEDRDLSDAPINPSAYA